MDSILQILTKLIDEQVEFVLIGGLAAVAHGSSLVTEDLDVAAPLTEENAARILRALADVHPVHRMTPRRRPMHESAVELAGFENLNLVTDLGQVDFLGQVAGIGDFAKVARSAVTIEIDGRPCKVLDLDALIRSKEALGRPRDQRAVAQLRAIQAKLANRRKVP